MRTTRTGVSARTFPFVRNPTAYGCPFANAATWHRVMAMATTPPSANGGAVPAGVVAPSARAALRDGDDDQASGRIDGAELGTPATGAQAEYRHPRQSGPGR